MPQVIVVGQSCVRRPKRFFFRELNVIGGCKEDGISVISHRSSRVSERVS
jgi:hypothetical protein